MSDPRMEDMGADVPFDAKRMILGGFEAIVEEGSPGGGYVDGFVVPGPGSASATNIGSSPAKNGQDLPSNMARTASSKRSATMCRRAKSPISIAQ